MSAPLKVLAGHGCGPLTKRLFDETEEERTSPYHAGCCGLWSAVYAQTGETVSRHLWDDMHEALLGEQGAPHD